MSHNAVPTTAEIVTMLGALPVPIVLPAGFDIQSEIDAVVEALNARSGYQPFFQTSGTATSRAYDPPGPDRGGYSRGASTLMHLKNGLISLTSLSVGVVTADSDPGTELILGKDFWLYPSNAQANASRKKPYTHIEFAMPQRGLPQSIVVTGVWGYCNAANFIPADVWLAIRDMAVAGSLRKLLQWMTAMGGSIRELDVAESYDAGFIRNMISSLEEPTERVFFRYRLF